MAKIGTLLHLLCFLSISLFSPDIFIYANSNYTNEYILNNDTLPGDQFIKQINRFQSSTIKRVMIDAGHGGHDPGCLGKKSKEKDITLAIALELGKLINHRFPEIEVCFTRTTDIFVPLYKRIQSANRLKVDIFISIHVNYFADKDVSGTEVFVMGLHTAAENLRVAERENAAILFENDFLENYDGFNPNSTEGQIILSTFQNLYLSKSISLAKRISDQISFNTSPHIQNRGVKQAEFVILRKAAMPSVLIESGFLSNEAEENYLISPEGKTEIAGAICGAIGTYKKEVEQEFRSMEKLKAESINAGLAGDGGDSSEKIIYRIQLAAFKTEKKLTLPDYLAIEPIDLINENGLRKLIVGNYSTYEQAVEMKKILKRGDFKQAFVVAYLGDQRIGLHKAIRIKQSKL